MNDSEECDESELPHISTSSNEEMELEAKIHRLLAERAQRHHEEICRGPTVAKVAERDAAVVSLCREARSPWEVLADIRKITARRGFLSQQLRMQSLSQLKRWHAQLQLIEMDHTDATRAGGAHEELAASSSSNPQARLERSLVAIQRDCQCFDISFVASSARIDDLHQMLLETSNKPRSASEALAFSSTKGGYTMRVVLSKGAQSGSVQARSSLFMPALQSYVDELSSTRDSHVKALLDFLWSDVEQEQTNNSR